MWPRALTLSLETVQQSTLTIHPSWPQDLWVVLFFVLHSSFLPQSFPPYPFIPSFPSLAGVFSFPSLSYPLLDISFLLPSMFLGCFVLFVSFSLSIQVIIIVLIQLISYYITCFQIWFHMFLKKFISLVSFTGQSIPTSKSVLVRSVSSPLWCATSGLLLLICTEPQVTSVTLSPGSTWSHNKQHTKIRSSKKTCGI